MANRAAAGRKAGGEGGAGGRRRLTGPPVDPAREAALKALYQVHEEGAWAGLALKQVLQQERRLTPVDRRFAAELVYGSVRLTKTIDWSLGHYANRPLASLDPWARNILRLGAYQILYLQRIPAAAACNESANLMARYGHRGLVGLVNGVLRSLARGGLPALPDPTREPVAYLSLAYSHPEWLVRRWLQRYGREGTEALCAADNLAPPLVVRNNGLRVSPMELARRLAAEGVETMASPLLPEALRLRETGGVEGLASFREGLLVVQDEASMLVAHALDPAEDSLVVDACAGPGGKTSHLAELAPAGRVLACEVHPQRLELIASALKRLGLANVELRLEDARHLGSGLPETADFLLIDAPCSGLGVLRRRADARWRRTEAEIAAAVVLQRQILAGAADCLKRGGVLVYSTCSIEPEENQQVVADFLARRPDFTLDNLLPHLPLALMEPEQEQAREGQLQLLPHRYDCDGFFIARLRRQ